MENANQQQSTIENAQGQSSQNGKRKLLLTLTVILLLFIVGTSGYYLGTQKAGRKTEKLPQKTIPSQNTSIELTPMGTNDKNIQFVSLAPEKVTPTYKPIVIPPDWKQ